MCFIDLTGGVMAALLKAPRMKRRQAARVTENWGTNLGIAIMMIFTMLIIIREGSEVKEVGHEPLREAVQHVEHALPVEQGGEKTTDGRSEIL